MAELATEVITVLEVFAETVDTELLVVPEARDKQTADFRLHPLRNNLRNSLKS